MPDNKQQIITVLREVALDKTAPAAARVSAVKTLAELDGLLGRHAEKPNAKKALDDMTLEELAQEAKSK